MSGPKTSRYTLTAEQRRILLEKQMRELKIKTEKANIKQNTRDLLLLCEDICNPLDLARELSTRTGQGDEFIRSVTELSQQIKAVIDANADISKISEPEVLEQRRKGMDLCLKSVRQKAVPLKREADNLRHLLKNNLTEKIDEGFSMSFMRMEIKETTDNKHHTLQEQIIEKLNTLKDNMLPDEIEQELSSAISKTQAIEILEFLQNFNAITVIPLEKRCKQYISDYERNIDKFNELMARYKALCETLSIPIQIIAFSMDAIAKLGSAIKEMEEQLAKDIEDSYIADSIDEVMTEMGYTVLGSKNVQKSSGKRFRSELYSFDDGIAVNVTYSSDGKITMELGGLANEDRMPSSNEASKLCDQMYLQTNS